MLVATSHMRAVSGYKNNEINISTLSHQTVYQVINGCFRKKNCIILIWRYTFPKSKPIGFTQEKKYLWLSNDVECRTTIKKLGVDKINQLLNINLPPNTPANVLSNSMIDYLNNTSNFNQIFKF